jgi:flagellar hook-associated protein 3 FlgL
MTRITSGMIMDTSLFNIQKNQTRIEQLQSQLTSGSRITNPSDDPIGAARAMSFQETLDQTNQYLSNIDQATGWLNTTDNALGSVTNLLQRARELAVQAASDTASTQDRTAINSEVQQLQQQALTLAQSRYGSSYLFSGTRSDQPGYVQANPSTVPGAWQGNTNSIAREVSPGVTLGMNVPTDVTSSASPPPPLFDQVFSAFNQLQAGTTATFGPAPTLPAGLTTATTGGTLAAGTYTVAYSFTSATGESPASPLATVTTTGATSTINVAPPTLPPGATGWNAYISPVGASSPLYRQNAAPLGAASFTQSAPPSTTGAQAPGTPTIQASIGSLDTALNAMLTARAQNGAKMNRVDFLSQQLNDQRVGMSSLLSQVKDVDFASAITSFSMAQSVYQASLKAGAQALQLSLLDYLH